jgi:hypothetical protein
MLRCIHSTANEVHQPKEFDICTSPKLLLYIECVYLHGTCACSWAVNIECVYLHGTCTCSWAVTRIITTFPSIVVSKATIVQVYSESFIRIIQWSKKPWFISLRTEFFLEKVRKCIFPPENGNRKTNGTIRKCSSSAFQWMVMIVCFNNLKFLQFLPCVASLVSHIQSLKSYSAAHLVLVLRHSSLE